MFFVRNLSFLNIKVQSGFVDGTILKQGERQANE